MSSYPSCHVCGENKYEKRYGFYVCVSCDTQSQEIQEEHFEQTADNFNADRAEVEDTEVVTECAPADRKLTSWEVYNIVLKGVLDEIVSLGASCNMSIIAFQMWASFLRKAEAAFISKHCEKLPRLPLGFKNEDAKILYKVKNLRKKIYGGLFREDKAKKRKKCDIQTDLFDTNSTCSGSSHTSFMKSFRKKQRSLALSEISSESEGSITNVSTVESLAMKTPKKKHLKIPFLRSVKKQLCEFKKVAGNVEAHEDVQSDDLDDKEFQEITSRKTIASRKINGAMNYLNMPMLVSILQLALYVTESDIQLGDVLRWIFEGRLSFCKPQTFLKETEYSLIDNLLTNSSRRGFLDEMLLMARTLDINFIPSPNLLQLAQRYCLELQLPDYESRVMAYIMFAAKLLFSLDGLTELNQSEIADTYNSFNNHNECKLFSWNAWVRYIECRKATLAKYSMYIGNRSYNGQFVTESTFRKHWNAAKNYESLCEKNKVNELLSLSLRKLFDQMQPVSNTNDDENVDFPSSLTPQYTYLQYLLENRVNLIPERSRDILNCQFTATSIRFLLENNWFQDNINGVFTIDIDENIPKTFDLDKREEFIQSPFQARSNINVPAYKPISVNIIGSKKESDKKTESKLTNFHPIITKLKPKIAYSNNDKNRDNKNRVLYRPNRNYWIYRFPRKLTTELFEEESKQYLPFSFLWFLKECSNIIGAEPLNIYAELQLIECILYKRFINKKYKMSTSYHYT